MFIVSVYDDRCKRVSAFRFTSLSDVFRYIDLFFSKNVVFRIFVDDEYYCPYFEFGDDE